MAPRRSRAILAPAIRDGGQAMRRQLCIVAACLCAASTAWAVEMPTRKAGEWEIKMDFAGHNLPARTMRECIDAVSDRQMNNIGGEGNCSKRDISKLGDTMVVDSVCQFGAATTRSHAVMTGSFDSAYTVEVTSTRTGGPPIPGMAAGGTSHMKIAAKWLGPCPAGERPGDIMMGNGMKMNVLDLQKMRGRIPPR
jgi:Protein of unknown function (DUF3617)